MRNYLGGDGPSCFLVIVENGLADSPNPKSSFWKLGSSWPNVFASFVRLEIIKGTQWGSSWVSCGSTNEQYIKKIKSNYSAPSHPDRRGDHQRLERLGD